MTVSIGGIKVDLLKSLSAGTSLEVTSHPVEDGADVSDHARLNNLEVELTVLIVGEGADRRLERLERKQRNKKLVDVIAPRRYKNMQITNISPGYTHDVANGHVVSLTLQQVRVSKAKTFKLKKRNSGRKQVKKKKASTNKKTRDKMAREVIAGKWGNQPHRERRLRKAGYNYDEIQARVNAILR